MNPSDEPSFSSSPKRETEPELPVSTPSPVLTRYFTFGWGHTHFIEGRTLDKDIVLRITHADPRGVMTRYFGLEWASEYYSEPQLEYYPQGVVDFPFNHQ